MRKWLHCADNFTHNQASPRCIRGSPGCHFHTHFTPSPMGVIISNHELICISVVVGGNTPKCSPGRTSLESFPQTLKTREGAGRYINAFWAPFQGLPPLSHQDGVCPASLLPPGNPPSCRSAAPQGGFPTNLVGSNLSDWAALIQDMVAGLQALPPSLGSCLGLHVVNLLQLLEAATGVGFCRFCCNLPDSRGDVRVGAMSSTLLVQKSRP